MFKAEIKLPPCKLRMEEGLLQEYSGFGAL